MTDVLILKNIAGAFAGQIVPMDERLQKHIDAGNARILADTPAAAHAHDHADAVAHAHSHAADDDLELDELDEDDDEDTED